MSSLKTAAWLRGYLHSPVSGLLPECTVGTGILNFTLQWWGTHGDLGASSDPWCVHLYRRCLSNGEGTYTPSAFSALLLCRISWWVGYPLLGRGRCEGSKWLSSKLNLNDIAGLSTQRVFKCDCSRILLVDLLFGFASFSSLLSTLAHICLVYSLFMFIQRTDLLGNRAPSLHAAVRSPLSAWGYPCSLLWKGKRAWVMTYLCPHQHCSCIELHCWSALNHEKYLRATSSGTLRRYSPAGFQIRGQMSESSSQYICL